MVSTGAALGLAPAQRNRERTGSGQGGRGGDNGSRAGGSRWEMRCKPRGNAQGGRGEGMRWTEAGDSV